MRSSLLRKAASGLAHRVVRGYPQAWRERYESEVLALLDDSPARFRDVVDLARGLVVERARATFEPGERPRLTAVLVAIELLARAVVIMSVPLTAGWIAGLYFGPLPRLVRSVAGLLAPAIMLTFAIRSMRRYSPTAVMLEPQPALFSGLAGHVWVGVILAVTFVMSWDGKSVLAFLLFGHIVADYLARPPRPWRSTMAIALHRLRSAKNDMKWALMELERCERLAKRGLPAPLQDREARNELARLERQRDEAMATLHGLGYRASLRSGLTPDP